MRKALQIIPLVILTMALSGCPKNPIHPGAANQFDSQAYDVVLLYHDAIETTKADLTAGTFPVSGKPILNKFIDAYNVLDAAYKAYHKAAQAGTSTAAQIQAVQDAEAQAVAAFSDLLKIHPKLGALK